MGAHPRHALRAHRGGRERTSRGGARTRRAPTRSSSAPCASAADPGSPPWGSRGAQPRPSRRQDLRPTRPLQRDRGRVLRNLVLFLWWSKAGYRAGRCETSRAGSGIPVFGARHLADQVIDEILRQAAGCGAEPHGQYSRADADRLQGSGRPVWRVVGWPAPARSRCARRCGCSAPTPCSSRPRAPHLPVQRRPSGGEFSSRRRFRRAHDGACGGLTPGNGRQGGGTRTAEVVDVSSGVESLL